MLPKNWSRHNESPQRKEREDQIRKSRFSEEQIVGIVGEHESGVSAAELSRRHGVSEQTIYCWKQKYGGVEGAELRRLKALEAENARLKRLVSEQALNNQMLKEVLGKKW